MQTSLAAISEERSNELNNTTYFKEYEPSAAIGGAAAPSNAAQLKMPSVAV